MKKHLKSARTLAIVVAVLCVTVLATSLHLRSLAAAAKLAPTSSELATTMIRAGLDPAALAGAGLSSNETESVVQAVLSWMVDQHLQLTSADQAFAAARREHDRLLRRVRSGRATEQEISEFQQARATLATVRTQRQNVLNAIFESATASMNGAQRFTLTRIRLNRSWKQPTEFLTVDRTQEEWVALRDALANERISAENGEDPDPDAQALLAQLRSNPAVSAAKANLDANLALITATWEGEIGL